MPPAPINPLAYLSQFTGYDDQGGYAVANDAGKLFGQALAEYDARLKAQREWDTTTHAPITGIGIPPKPTWTPESLQRELLDPLSYHFGLHGGAVQPRTYHVGDALLQLDPLTGKATPIYTAPPKPVKQPTETAVEIPMKYDIFGKPSAKLKVKPTEVPGLVDAGIIPQSLLATNDVARSYYQMGLHRATNNPAPSTLSPTGNAFTNAVQQGKQAVESGANPAAGTRQIGRFTVKSK